MPAWSIHGCNPCGKLLLLEAIEPGARTRGLEMDDEAVPGGRCILNHLVPCLLRLLRNDRIQSHGSRSRDCRRRFRRWRRTLARRLVLRHGVRRVRTGTRPIGGSSGGILCRVLRPGDRGCHGCCLARALLDSRIACSPRGSGKNRLRSVHRVYSRGNGFGLGCGIRLRGSGCTDRFLALFHPCPSLVPAKRLPLLPS